MKKHKEAYLTKRIVERASRAAVRKAAKRTMAVMGYNVEVINGNVVKKFADGRIEFIESVPVSSTRKVILD